jgi:2-iminoacetate synthase
MSELPPALYSYFEGMEQIKSGVMEETLKAAAGYDPSVYTREYIRRALDEARKDQGQGCSIEDFGIFLSPAASPFLEEMAHAAREEKLRRFGNSISLFTPLYISNYCENACVYCGFKANNPIRRSKLEFEEIEIEMKAIKATGLEEILILTGESAKHSSLEYIGRACGLAKQYFRVVGLEVYPMNCADYAYLKSQGADFITVFQETYDPELYGELHPAGRKRSFSYRFNTQERALLGGIRGVAFASLLGLGEFRRDAYATGIHAWAIQRKYPHAEISFSCPRLRPIVKNNDKNFKPFNVSEAELLQVICAFRLFMPSSGITISSRENARFRDHACEIAVTRISAGVDVGIGGHSGVSSGDEQFEISDSRNVEEIYRMLLSRGLQPVMSDYIDV